MTLYEWTGVMALLLGAYYALVKVIVSQFKNELSVRFEAQEKLLAAGRQEWANRFERIERQMHDFDADISGINRELPLAYVRREDAIRENTIINAKLDALNDKLEKIAERRTLPRR